MPERWSKAPVPQRRSVHVGGIFEAWHYCRCSWLAVPSEVELERLDDRAYSEALDDARDRAEVDAAERIGTGQAITAVLLRAGHRMTTPWTDDRDSFTVPQLPMFSEDPDRLFDIAPSDVATVSDAATAEWKAKRAAEAERRASTVAERHGHNGAEVGADVIEVIQRQTDQGTRRCLRAATTDRNRTPEPRQDPRRRSHPGQRRRRDRQAP
jgi:hypothetical protein